MQKYQKAFFSTLLSLDVLQLPVMLKGAGHKNTQQGLFIRSQTDWKEEHSGSLLAAPALMTTENKTVSY